MVIMLFATLIQIALVVHSTVCQNTEERSITDRDVNLKEPLMSNDISREDHVGKILFPLPTLSRSSHYQQIAAISSGLVEKGHEVHLLSNNLPRDRKMLSLFNASKTIPYNTPITEELVSRMMSQVATQSIKSGLGIGGHQLITQALKTQSLDCRGLFSDANTIARLQGEGYKLIVSDLFTPCEALLARHLNVSFVAYTTSREYPCFRGRVYGFPSELSYRPETFFGFTDKMSFWQRVQNVIYHLAVGYIASPLLLQDFVQIQKDFNIDTDTYILDIMGKAMLWLNYVDWSLEFPHPTMPNYISIGGLALKEAQNLTKELEDFVQGSGSSGVVIFSLGSMIDYLDDDSMTSMIARVFSRLPQRIIWRHNGTEPANLGNNTKILKWIPQNDLLGHPKTRLFIGHGGLNGVYEALYHAVPMILLPIMAPDQWDNAARVVAKEMGLQLDVRSLTEETFYEAITTVLNTTGFRKKVSHYSAILRDLPPAKDRAVFWIEHVMKFGDAHLRAHVFELNLIQYYLVDVAAFIVLLATMLLLVLTVTCRLCFRVCKGSAKMKVD